MYLKNTANLVKRKQSLKKSQGTKIGWIFIKIYSIILKKDIV